jgi:hypothetical protein
MVEFRAAAYGHRSPKNDSDGIRNLAPDPLRIAAVDPADYANSADLPMIDCDGAL